MSVRLSFSLSSLMIYNFYMCLSELKSVLQRSPICFRGNKWDLPSFSEDEAQRPHSKSRTCLSVPNVSGNLFICLSSSSQLMERVKEQVMQLSSPLLERNKPCPRLQLRLSMNFQRSIRLRAALGPQQEPRRHRGDRPQPPPKRMAPAQPPPLKSQTDL